MESLMETLKFTIIEDDKSHLNVLRHFWDCGLRRCNLAGKATNITYQDNHWMAFRYVQSEACIQCICAFMHYLIAIYILTEQRYQQK